MDVVDVRAVGTQGDEAKRRCRGAWSRSFRMRPLCIVTTVVAAALVPRSGHAQLGAIGAGVSNVVTEENRYENAPVFFLSALVMPRGQWAVGASGTASGLPLEFGDGFELGKLRRTGLAASAYYGAGTRLTLGIVAQPYASTSFDCSVSFCQGINIPSLEQSGMGDVNVAGVYQAWRSADGATKVGLLGRLWLPTAAEGLGLQGTSPEAALIVTHHLERLTLNANTSYTIMTDDADGDSVWLVDGAAVLAVSRTIGLSLEAGAQFSGGENLVQLGPALRIKLGSRTFFEIGGLFGVTTSLPGSASDFYLVTTGLAFVPSGR